MSKVYLYTDGVTEAHNANDEMFGDERMIDALVECEGMTAEEIDNHVRRRVKEFAGNVEQYDDITTLCFIYKGID